MEYPDPAVRRPTMIYWTDLYGTIIRAESENARLIETEEETFTSPFSCNDIIGRNLFNFIGNIEVRHVYRALTERVIQTGRTVTSRYRCDSSKTRREMSIELSRDAMMVRYKSVLLSETPRRTPVPEDSPDSSVFVAICSFCKNYRFPLSSNIWRELDELLMEKDLPGHFSLTHSICKGCYQDLIGEFD